MGPDQSTPSQAEQQGAAWARPVPARLAEAIAALALVAAGLLFMWEASLLPFGRVGLPGPGFFPFALAVALVLLASAILFLAVRGAFEGEGVLLGHRNVVLAVIALVGVALAFERFDTYVVLGTFSAFMLLFLARAVPWRGALAAALGMVAVWLFFGIALGLRLPTGELWKQITGFLAAALPFSQQ